MNLGGLFSAKPVSSTQLFFMVYFGELHVQAVLWQVAEGQLEIVVGSQLHQWRSEAELIDATDHALQELGKESEHVRETLFALEPTWVNQQGILVDKKALFQKLTKELTLEAVGFVVIPEAVIQHELHLQGTALHCFVIEVLNERVSFSLAKDGKLGQQEMVGRSSNVVDDIREGFARFTETPLPSTIFLYSAILTPEELEECRQRLLELDLLSQFSFLQQPRFEVIPEEEMLPILIQTGGRAVAEARGLVSPTDPIQQFPPEEIKTVGSVEEGVLAEEEATPQSEVEPAFFPAEPEAALELSEQTEQMAQAQVRTPDFPPMEPDSFPQRDEFPSFAEATRKPATPFLSNFTVPENPVLFAAIGVVIGVIILIIVLLTSARTALTAQVTVNLKTTPISKDVSLKLDPLVAVSDPNAGILKAEVLKQTISGEKTAETTGKKQVGEKAKGKVTLFNRTSSAKNFPAGSVLQTGKLKFLLDSSVTVASASTGKNFETNPGKTEANVTAAALGPDSNIPAETELGIDSFAKDTYVARTTQALTGGTSRDIRAVSQKDQDELAAALKKELQQQAAQQLQQSAGNGKYVFPSNKLKVLSAQFSSKVGEEASSVTLKLNIEAEALSYSSSELQTLATQVLSAQVPAGQTFQPESLQVLTSPATTATNSAQVNLSAQFTAASRATAHEQEWITEIAGKSEQAATDTLQKKPEVAHAQIVRTPAFFARFSANLPADPKKIKMVVR